MEFYAIGTCTKNLHYLEHLQTVNTHQGWATLYTSFQVITMLYPHCKTFLGVNSYPLHHWLHRKSHLYMYI